MATTKTLSPTNQTITIDAFQGEKPDHRHVADAETKLADAVNALNSQIMYADSGGTFNSLATLSTLLNNALSNSNNKRKLLRLACNGTFDCFYTGVSYFVDLKVSSASYSSCIMQGVGYNSVIIGTLSNGTWSFQEQGVKSSVKSVTTGADGTVIISDYGFDSVVSITMESVNNYFCAIRKSQSGNILLFVYGTSFTPVANATLNVRIWYK